MSILEIYLRVSLFDPDTPIPDPPVPNPPNFVRTDWDDPRIPGYKIGDGDNQTKPEIQLKVQLDL